MFIKLHKFDGTGKTNVQIINIHSIRTIHFSDPVKGPMGSSPGFVKVTWNDGGSAEFVLALVESDGTVGEHLAPRDFELSFAVALRLPGIHELQAN